MEVICLPTNEDIRLDIWVCSKFGGCAGKYGGSIIVVGE